MYARRMIAVIVSVVTALVSLPSHAQGYTTDWLGNSYGKIATHVGNAARSMWVAPEGIIYTASYWDETEGGVAIYQDDKNIGSIGAHNDFQGGAIAGNSTSIFVAMSGLSKYGSGTVGRYDRTSLARDMLIHVSASNNVTRADAITGLVATDSELYASDFYANRVHVYTTDGTPQRDIAIAQPGALALDSAGNLWVAQQSAGTITAFSPSGAQLASIQMPAGSQPSALFFDAPHDVLMVGDSGPDMNIKLYDIMGAPTLAGTFGIKGGYLDTTQGVKGTVGDKRFTRIAGIGRDSAGNLYVLNNPWYGGWDMGRSAATDLHAYDSSGTLLWKLQALNFEAVAAPDPATDAKLFYSGGAIFEDSGTPGGTFVANTLDPFDYPNDPRLNMNDPQRGEHFGQLASVGGKRILVAGAQNPNTFYFYYFNAANGDIAIPLGSIPGQPFNTSRQVRNGFCLDSRGDVWAGLDHTVTITHYPLTGFDSTGKPQWGDPTTVATPNSVLPLTRIIYLPASDTMILAQGIAGSRDWTAMNGHIEVYRGWSAGNTSQPGTIITLTAPNPETIAAAGDYLFVGYVHTVPNIDVYSLTTGQKVTTLTNADPSQVDVGNDVDSMYGLRVYLRADGQYVIAKDNYNGSSVIVHRWTP